MFCGLEIYGLYWNLLLLCCGGPEMSVLFVCCQAGMGGVGNNGVSLVCGYGCAGCFTLSRGHFSATCDLFLTFEGQGSGTGHVLEGL